MPKKIPADFNIPLYPNLVQPLPPFIGNVDDYTAKNNKKDLTDKDKVSDTVTKPVITNIDSSGLGYNVKTTKGNINNEPDVYGIPKSKKLLGDENVY